MGYKSDGSLADLFPDSYVDEVTREIVDEVGDFLLREVRERTPVYSPPPGMANDDADSEHEKWAERGGRVPGTLKKSWYKGETEVAIGNRYVVTIATDDPIAPHVEYPTQAHIIKPKKVDGYLRFRNKTTGDVIYTQIVHHPGTSGSYMMRDSLREVRAKWQAIGKQVIIEHANRYRRV